MQTHIMSIPLLVATDITKKYKTDHIFPVSAIDVYYGPVTFDLDLGLITIAPEELHSMQGLNLFYLQVTYTDNETGTLSLCTKEFIDMLVSKAAPDIIVTIHTIAADSAAYAIANAPEQYRNDIAKQMTPAAQHKIDQQWKL